MLRRDLLVLLFGLVCASCAKADAAQDPVWGKQPCAHCKMLVSDPRFAAQATTSGGEHVYFDDVGCLVSYLTDHPDAKNARVRDPSGRWLDARATHYRHGVKTPMDFGCVVDAAGPLDFSALAALVSAKNAGGS